jgi:toxin FitB
VRYLLDTCALSEPWKPRPDPAVLGWLEAADEDACHVSVLSIGELHKGVAKLPEGHKRDDLHRWVTEGLLPRFGSRVLLVSAPVARRWGELAGEAERRGAPLPVVDALLAATALVHDLRVVTRNVEHFGRVGAQVINPWS